MEWNVLLASVLVGFGVVIGIAASMAVAVLFGATRLVEWLLPKRG